MIISTNKVSTTTRFSASEKGKIVSSLYIRDKQDGKQVYLYRLKTNKTHRRQHLASDLLKLVVDKYKDRGITLRACHLEGSLSNTALMNMYRKHGFKRKGTSKVMYIDPPKELKVGDKTKLHCPNCNSFMRIAKLSYWFTTVGAYDSISSTLSDADNGKKCHKCNLEFVPGNEIRFDGFKINRWNTIEDLKQWLDDVKAGKGKDIMVTS